MGKIITTKTKDNGTTYYTAMDEETFKNFNKGTKKAVAISIDDAKEIAKEMFENIKKSPNKNYYINFLYGDIWRNSYGFGNKDKVRFPGDGRTETNGNTDLYDYVYGIEVIERDK